MNFREIDPDRDGISGSSTPPEYFSPDGAAPTVRLRQLDTMKTEGRGKDALHSEVSVDEAIRFFVERKGAGAKLGARR